MFTSYVSRLSRTRYTQTTNDRDETTLGPPTQFDSRALYLNAAQANLKFPSQFFAGFGAVTLPRDSRLSSVGPLGLRTPRPSGIRK